MKAPPPLAAALAGKRRKFPSPMAEPATAMMIPKRLAQLSRAGFFVSDMAKFYYDSDVFSTEKAEFDLSAFLFWDKILPFF